MNRMSLLILVGLLSVMEPEHDPEERAEAMDRYDTPLDQAYENHVVNICEEYGLDPAVVFAVMWQESRYTADAVGDSGRALGIMQIQPRWHADRMARLGVTDLLDERQAALVGCDYLSELLARYGTYQEALTAYRYGDLTVTGEDYAGVVLEKAEEIRK